MDAYWGWIILAGIILWFVGRPMLAAMRDETPAAPGLAATDHRPPAFDWPATGDYEFEVVGESHYQHYYRAIVGDHGDEAAHMEIKVNLCPQPDNPHDANAMAVTIAGRVLGYLSRDDAPSFKRRLSTKGLGNQVTSCNGLITGGWLQEDGSRAMYGLALDLKPFE